MSVRSKLQRWLYFPLKRFRRKRMEWFYSEFHVSDETRILDVGGTPWIWSLVQGAGDITLLNTNAPDPALPVPANVRHVEGDGARLPFPDDSFDICFSNSTIEHVYSWENQQAFAAEVRRVAPRLWLQTPAREFFIEPHWKAPFIHWLPKPVQRRVARNLTPYGLVYRPTKDEAADLVEEFRLLTHDEMVELFPDCEIRRERFLGMTKSYVAVRS